jgi:tetratricopeptide (TPR) repeat protein
MNRFQHRTASSRLNRRLAVVASWLHRTILFVGLLAFLGIARAEEGEWIELKTPYFTMWSEASEKRTHDWAVEFELFRRGMNQLIPADESHILPAQIILFRSDRRLRPYLATENGQPSKASGYTSRQFGKTIIAIGVDGSRDDVRDLVYAATLDWHLSAADRPLPDWLELGLGQVFTTFVIQGNSCNVGANRPGVYRYVRVAGSLPFERLVSLEAQELGFSEANIDFSRQVHAQCWAIAEALLFTSEGIGWDAFRKYMQESPAGGSPQAELERTFGLSAASLDRRLATYLQRGKPERVTATFDRTNIDAGFATRKLAGWETDLVLGSLLTATGRLDEADGHLARAFLAADTDGRVREALAIQHLAKQELGEAGREAQQAIDHGRNHYLNHYIVASARLEDVALTGDRGTAPPDAVGHLVECLTLNPRFIPSYQLLGRMALSLGPNATQAQDLLLVGGSRYGGMFEIQAGCAIVAARRSDFEATDRYLAAAKALAGSPDSRKGKYFTTIENAVADTLAPARAIRALLSTPGEITPTALEKASPELLRDVTTLLDKGIKDSPTAELYCARAATKVHIRDFDGALADLREARLLKPDMIAPVELMAEVKWAKSDFSGSLAECDAALAAHPNRAKLYALRARSKANLGNSEAALADYDRAIELEPNSAEIHNDRGYMRRVKGDDTGALNDFNRAIELNPNFARAYSNRAAVRGAKGDAQGAVEDIGRASALNASAK